MTKWKLRRISRESRKNSCAPWTTDHQIITKVNVCCFSKITQFSRCIENISLRVQYNFSELTFLHQYRILARVTKV